MSCCKNTFKLKQSLRPVTPSPVLYYKLEDDEGNSLI